MQIIVQLLLPQEQAASFLASPLFKFFDVPTLPVRRLRRR
ncbi:MAG: hypothetical protein NVS9B9_27560 [Ktedonobacteraceae bacterium]